MYKNTNKSKLIYWSKDLILSGNEKYFILSADLLIDQDSFWENIHNHKSNNNKSNKNIADSSNIAPLVSYNSTALSRNNNRQSANPPLPPKLNPSYNNNNTLGIGSNK